MTRARDLARFANNQALSVDTDFDVGINSTTPAAKLDVRGDSVITGILTATSFSGNITGDATGLSGTPDITVNNIVAAGATFSGVLTYEDVTNVDSVGIVTARTGVEVTANGLVVNAGVSTFKSDVTIRSANPTLDLIDTDGSTTASLSANSGNIFYDTSSTNRDHVFQGASSEVARITGDGLVGIGTDIPAQKLHIHNNGASRILLKRVGSNPSEADIRNEGELLTFTQNTDGITFNTGSGTPSERLRVTSGGQVRIGSSGDPSNKNTVTPLAHVDGSGVNGALQVNRHTSVGGGGSQLILSATRGSSITGHTILQDDDGMGTIEFAGSDGGEFVTGARIQAAVDGTPGDDDLPTRLIFSTTADGGSSPTERLRIDSRGSFNFSNGFMNETVKINTAARTGTQAVNLDEGMVHYFSTNSSGTWKPNFTMSAGDDINATIATGDVFSPTMIVAKGATTHYANAIQVDGSDVTPEFLGGAPSDGGGSGTFDIYSYTIIKTGDDTFKAFASVSNYE